MIAELQCLVLDCPDPPGLARFYAAVLGGEVNRPDHRWATGDGWATLHLPGGQVLAFQRVSDYRPPRRPDPAHPQQFHPDFAVPDLEEAGRQVLALGATLLDGADAGRSWSVYADPAGHPFCLVRHR
ncbi:VOC family protein [Streptomyces sp. NPDC057445]|uniref:VOC family protein n=1 Tax=Streptomyces sp. NPDC057445 TaxID=3346136 RepID=UPI003699FC07